MTETKKHTRTSGLAALTGAALALPAIAQLAHAEPATQQTEISYRYSSYQEDDLKADDILVGSKERYDVKHHQFRLLTPLNGENTLTVDADYETMSGASAYGTTQGLDGNPKLIMSGASIDETRKDILASLRRQYENGAFTVSLGYSDEKDYTAYNGAVEFEKLSVDRLTTYSGGLGYSSDTVEPVQTAGINRIDSEDKWSLNGFVAAATVLSPVWQVQAGLFSGLSDGYLSDPYKARDMRPDSRQSWGITGRSRYYLKAMHAALNADYRFYSDDWGIEAHTLELAWQQEFGDQVRLVPSVRYYSQSQADFYVDSDSVLNQGEQSSDFRLAPFGALSYGLSLILEQETYSITLHGERYDSDADLALKNVEVENPALVSYTLMTLGFDFRF